MDVLAKKQKNALCGFSCLLSNVLLKPVIFVVSIGCDSSAKYQLQINRVKILHINLTIYRYIVIDRRFFFTKS